jgi:hypothetical protein
MSIRVKKILFFSSEPGGAEALCPVIRLLNENSYEVVVASHGYGAVQFCKNSILYTDVVITSIDAAVVALRKIAPDYLITSATSLPWIDMSEKYLWEAAHQLGIGSLAFIDQWQNYSIRFSGSQPFQLLKYLPDHINSINQFGREEMIAEGFPEDRLIMLGHPYLSGIVDCYNVLNVDDIVRALGIAYYNFNRDEALVFVSEPLLENFGNSRGYNQYDALCFFLTNLDRFTRKKHVVLKLHPKDELWKFKMVIGMFPEINIHIVQDELSSIECLTLSDKIFGMTSIMLIEAFLLGKTVVSLQPGLINEDPLILSRRGLVSRVIVLEDLNHIVLKPSGTSAFPVAFDKITFLKFIADKSFLN